jgi:hypothetical protein
MARLRVSRAELNTLFREYARIIFNTQCLAAFNPLPSYLQLGWQDYYVLGFAPSPLPPQQTFVYITIDHEEYIYFEPSKNNAKEEGPFKTLSLRIAVANDQRRIFILSMQYAAVDRQFHVSMQEEMPAREAVLKVYNNTINDEFMAFLARDRTMTGLPVFGEAEQMWRNI